jgi:hypothetical protein
LSAEPAIRNFEFGRCVMPSSEAVALLDAEAAQGHQLGGSIPARQPQQSSLTREEIRAIILEQIGQYLTCYGRNIRHLGG